MKRNCLLKKIDKGAGNKLKKLLKVKSYKATAN